MQQTYNNSSTKFASLLARPDSILADGATGTSLMHLGLPVGESPERLNLTAPQLVRRHYRAFLETEAQILLTNSFGGNGARLQLHGLESQVAEVNEAAASLLVEEAQACGRSEVRVAGSMGPTGSLLAPLGARTAEQAQELFRAQAAGLKAGGADCAWIETLSCPNEARAALAGAQEAGLPAVLTFSFDTAGCTMMGLRPETVPTFARDCADASPVAFGSNCGSGLADFLDSFRQLAAAAENNALLVARANCGVPQHTANGIVWPADTDDMAAWALWVRDLGAKIIGGCCGTQAEHIQAMARALQSRPAQPLSQQELLSRETESALAERFGKPWRAKREEVISPLVPNPEGTAGRGRRRTRRAQGG